MACREPPSLGSHDAHAAGGPLVGFQLLVSRRGGRFRDVGGSTPFRISSLAPPHPALPTQAVCQASPLPTPPQGVSDGALGGGAGRACARLLRTLTVELEIRDGGERGAAAEDWSLAVALSF